MPEIIFKCPRCGGSKIEEIMVEMTVASEVSISKEEADETGPGDICTNYGEQINEGGHVDRYQCGECGYTIVDEGSGFADGGVDTEALARAIHAINNPSKGDLVNHGELVQRISDQYATLSGQELADEWNRLFPEQVTYEGDSLYWMKEG